METATHHDTALLTPAVTGVLAGIAGGIVFGALMAVTGMLPMIASLVGSTSPVVGALVHLVISAGLGTLFAVSVPARSVGVLLAAGAPYGMMWWVFGPLLIMPLWLDMPLFAAGTTAVMNLMGHVIFGLVMAGVLAVLRHRPRAAATTA